MHEIAQGLELTLKNSVLNIVQKEWKCYRMEMLVYEAVCI